MENDMENERMLGEDVVVVVVAAIVFFFFV